MGDVTDDWCISNCAFTPPNCPAALCKCAKPGGATGGASADAAAKEEGDGKPSLSPFAKAFERTRNENTAPDAEKLLRDMAKTKHKEVAKQAREEQEV